MVFNTRKIISKNRNALVTLATQFGIQFLGVGTGILSARLLGPDGRGELAAIIAWASMLTYTGNIGLPTAYVYAASRDPHRLKQLLGNGVLVMLVQWLLLALIGYFVLSFAFVDYPNSTKYLAIIYLCIYVPLNLLTLYANAIQQGFRSYGGFNAVRLCVPISYLLGLLFLIFTDWTTVTGVLTANLFSNVATLILAIFLIFPLLRGLHAQRWLDWKALKQDISYGISAHLGSLQPFSGLRVDVLLLTLFSTPHDLGLYVASLAGAGLIKAQGSALGMIIMPDVARNPNFLSQSKTILNFVLFATLLGGATAVIALLWAEPLINFVYGKEFGAAASVLRILVISAFLESINRVLADGLRGIGKPLSSTTGELIALIIGIPCIIWLVPVNGAAGAAIAVCLASVGTLTISVGSLLNLKRQNRAISIENKIIDREYSAK